MCLYFLGDLDEPVITLPIQFFQLAQSSPSFPPPHSVPQTSQNVLPAGLAGQFVIRTNTDGSKSFLIDTSNISVSIF